MKKLRFFSFLFLCMLLTSLSPAAAAANYQSDTSESLPESADFSEISQLEEAILSELYDDYTLEYGEEPAAFPSNLDFSNAVKVYVDTDVLALNTDSRDAILDALDSGNYVWDIYSTVNGVPCYVTVARGLPLNEDRASPLTEEEQESIRNSAGHWKITAAVIDHHYPSFAEQITTQLTENPAVDESVETVVVAGGIPAFHYPIAIAFNEEKAVQWISLDDGDLVTASLRDELENASASTFSADARDTLAATAGSGVYDFNALSDYARVCAQNADSSLSGGGGSESGSPHATFLWAAGIAVALGLLLCVFLLLRKRSA